MGRDPDERAPSPRISIIIAARDATPFLEPVLASIPVSRDGTIEVVVVDDCSADDTAGLASRHGARVIRLPRAVGAAAARNAGARGAVGDVVMFTDHDCCLVEDAVNRMLATLPMPRDKVVLGGTYSLDPYDDHRFASCLQSLHVHYSETRLPEPDYIASHFLVMNRERFLEEGGFPESLSSLLPNGCCQDVLLCHLLRSRGYRLIMDPALQVRHIFNFTLRHSVFNAFWKSRAWTRVSLWEGSLLRDSGSASTEMKASALLLAFAVGSFLVAPWIRAMAAAGPLLVLASIAASARFHAFVHRHKGPWFALRAVGLYSLQLLAILAGALVGMVGGPILPRER
ncbi:MAG: glycosyltransferase [Candidatus Eisenbacteria bacterium]|jgi:glycosyltransferase involved in cell wall biosynthesis|nr:glycosyltransferase [Candidatus Eisenbacteria bacterium]